MHDADRKEKAKTSPAFNGLQSHWRKRAQIYRTIKKFLAVPGGSTDLQAMDSASDWATSSALRMCCRCDLGHTVILGRDYEWIRVDPGFLLSPVSLPALDNAMSVVPGTCRMMSSLKRYKTAQQSHGKYNPPTNYASYKKGNNFLVPTVPGPAALLAPFSVKNTLNGVGWDMTALAESHETPFPVLSKGQGSQLQHMSLVNIYLLQFKNYSRKN